MSIEKMSLVSIVGNMSDIDETLTRCVDSGTFHIEKPSNVVDLSEFTEFTSLEETDSFSDISAKLHSLATEFSINIDPNVSIEKMYDDDTLYSYVESLDKQLSEISSKTIELNDRLAEYELALLVLNHLHGLSISFDELFSLEHVKIRFGRIPFENYQKLEYYESKIFYFCPFDNDEDYYWGIYFAPQSNALGVDKIFDSLMFERIRLPDFFHGTPEDSITATKEKIEKVREEIILLERSKEKLRAEHSEKLPIYYKCIRYKAVVTKLKKSASTYHDSFCLAGYVPTSVVDNFSSRFNDIPSVSCVVQDPDVATKATPPTKLKNNRFAEPFQGFVQMYGLPDYKGIDPTNLVAITYTLLFGIMFGDLGQGLVISLIGMLAWEYKKMFLGRILTRVGLSSAFFGLVYGSVFGFEEALNPIYKLLFGLDEKPIHVFEGNTTTMLLLGAVGLGAVFIVITIIINIIVGIRKKDHERAFFGANSISGLVLYVSAILAAVLLMMFDINVLNPLFIIVCIIIPLVFMFLREPLAYMIKHRKPKKLEGGIGGFIIENFFEVFEFVLSYVTNTMSFLRVGGFILSHAGMMAVVMTLSEMVGTAASPFVLVIGNLFVMGIEGLIVGIQVLRLEFYEVFSRFYDGNGTPFDPVKVSYDIEENNN